LSGAAQAGKDDVPHIIEHLIAALGVSDRTCETDGQPALEPATVPASLPTGSPAGPIRHHQ
jgi:hypothetical protein